MHPVLFVLPILGLTLHTYGVLVALGFLASMWWAGREAGRLGENPAHVSDAVFYTLLGGILGARIFYVVGYDWNNFIANPLTFFKIWEGGLVFHGGLIIAQLALLWFVRRIRRSYFRYTDILSPALALGHLFGRIGCFFAGCCYGRQCPIDAWFAVVFPHNELGIVPTGVPLYPTQLMEALGNLAIFGLLWLVARRQTFVGQVTAAYLMLYGALRFVIEIYRHAGTQAPLWNTGLSQAQGVGLAAIAIGFALWLWGSKKGTAA